MKLRMVRDLMPVDIIRPFSRGGLDPVIGVVDHVLDFLAAVGADLSAAQGSDDGPQEGREVLGLSGGNDVAVDADLLIHELGPGMDQVVLDGKKGGDLLALEDFGRSQIQPPWQMAAAILPCS